MFSTKSAITIAILIAVFSVAGLASTTTCAYNGQLANFENLVTQGLCEIGPLTVFHPVLQEGSMFTPSALIVRPIVVAGREGLSVLNYFQVTGSGKMHLVFLIRVKVTNPDSGQAITGIEIDPKAWTNSRKGTLSSLSLTYCPGGITAHPQCLAAAGQLEGGSAFGAPLKNSVTVIKFQKYFTSVDLYFDFELDPGDTGWGDVSMNGIDFYIMNYNPAPPMTFPQPPTPAPPH